MYTNETRKLHLIAEVLKLKSDAVLSEIEKLLKSSKDAPKKASALTIYDFVGFLSDKEAKDMKDTISATCETIDEDVWK